MAKRLDDCLLVGPQRVWARPRSPRYWRWSLRPTFHEALGQSITSSADLNALLLAAKDNEIIFIDEVHELQKIFQTALYLALDKSQSEHQWGSQSVQSIPLAKFSLVLGTTDEYFFLSPLRDTDEIAAPLPILCGT